MQYQLRRAEYNKVLNLNEKHNPTKSKQRKCQCKLNFKIFERANMKPAKTIFSQK